MSELSCSVVVATRNRLDALEMSLPLLLRQTRKPNEIIVVDSSEDISGTRALVASLSSITDIPMQVIHSEPGLPLQRNIGVKAASHDIIIFPDDDSLYYPEAIATFMEVYEKDSSGAVAGVSVGESHASPLDEQTNEDIAEAYSEKSQSSLRSAIAACVIFLERRFFNHPFRPMSRWLVKKRPIPDNLTAMGCRAVGDLEGYRMSFRRSFVVENPFNEAMTFYAFGEDKDVSYAAWSDYCLVDNPKKLVKHHKFPSPRHNEFRRGFVEVVNPVYIISRYAPAGSPPRKSFGAFYGYLGFQLRLRSLFDKGIGERLDGHQKGCAAIARITNASREDIDEVYKEVMAEQFD